MFSTEKRQTSRSTFLIEYSRVLNASQQMVVPPTAIPVGVNTALNGDTFLNEPQLASILVSARILAAPNQISQVVCEHVNDNGSRASRRTQVETTSTSQSLQSTYSMTEWWG